MARLPSPHAKFGNVQWLGMTARVRVHLLTYKRPKLLGRALKSLLAQTLQDWTCELHNDAPDDPSPGELCQLINDPRIHYVPHERNLGPTATFNLLFKDASEPYLSLLEDDNWWERDFLEEMVATLERFPHVDVAWCNQNCWQEEADGTWTDLHRTVWQVEGTNEPRLIAWPQPYQISGALHSNGSMLLRSRHAAEYRIPDETPFDIIEYVRERTFSYPILFVPQTLANFSITQGSARNSNKAIWGQSQLLLASTFLRHTSLSTSTLQRLWQSRRASTPRSTGVLFHTAIVGVERRRLLKNATVRDWLHFLKVTFRRPIITCQILRSQRCFPVLSNFLDLATQERNVEGSAAKQSMNIWKKKTVKT